MMFYRIFEEVLFQVPTEATIHTAECLEQELATAVSPCNNRLVSRQPTTGYRLLEDNEIEVWRPSKNFKNFK